MKVEQYAVISCKIYSKKHLYSESWTVCIVQIFHEGSPYHVETSPLICRANHWTGVYVMGTSVMKELKAFVYL